MTPARIEVVIEELVLHGFAPGDHAALGAALESELARLLTAEGLPPTWAANPPTLRLPTGPFPAANGSSGAAATGTQIAQTIYHGGGQ